MDQTGKGERFIQNAGSFGVRYWDNFCQGRKYSRIFACI